ncbi:MAG: inorganic phosphate transporter, partial [Actinocatenispora sp.]
MVVAIFLLLVALAAANGGNDVAKGVATLAGAGVTRYRTAVLWGTATTLVGALVSLALAGQMTKLFSSGIVAARPNTAFTLAVLAGAASWVLLATIARLPVSTTHAVVGGLIGAGLLMAPGSVRFGALLTSVAVPLLASIFVAFAISWLLSLIPVRTPVCTCAGDEAAVPADAVPGPDGAGGGALD